MSKSLQDPRATEGQDRTAAVMWRDVFESYGCDDEVTVVSGRALARVRVAHSAIQTLVGMLYERELAMEDRPDEPVMSNRTAMGLLEAIACCTELAESHATTGQNWTTKHFSGEAGAQVNHHANCVQHHSKQKTGCAA